MKKIILFFAMQFVLIGLCYAGEGFLLIKDDTLLYKDKECKSVKSERPIYKFTFGEVQKKEAGKIYIRIATNVLSVGNYSSDKFFLEGCWGWINEDDVILFQYSKDPDLYDKAIRIFLKQFK